MRNIWVGAVIAVFLFGDGALAVPAELELDSLSFFYFEGAQVGNGLPPATIPLEVEKSATGGWTIRVPAAAFLMPPVTYPSGLRVDWRLTSDATGTISGVGGALRCQLSAPAMAYVDGAKTGIPWSFEFTTETSGASAQGLTATRQGARLDPTSGYLQLVATGVHAMNAATAPGMPYYAVLSGRIVGVDFSK